MRLLAALLLLHVATTLPDPRQLPGLDMAVLALLLAICGRSALGRLLQGLATMVLMLIVILQLADLTMAESLGRRFNPVADLPLIDALVRLLAGTVGVLAAIGACIGALLVGGLLGWAIWWSLGVVRRAGKWSFLSVLAIGALAAISPTTPGLTFAQDRLQLAARTVTQLAEFRRQSETDPMRRLAAPLSMIDRDVLVIFLESYGRTSFDTPFYADVHLPRLQDAQARLSAAGLAMRSGFLTSSTHGGQSWLAHATFQNGLWIGDQTRYQASVASDRWTLFDHARRAGFRTAAIMPAITRPWPEGTRMGFDTVHAADDLGYAGEPFNWVTMPDQFTLTATDRIREQGDDPRRLFAQVALISSHAPWTPVPRMVNWSDVGDGTVFNRMATEGPTPRQVWRDRETVRQHYRDAIDYTLQAVMEYAERNASDPPLLVLLGDHQAASSIGLDQRRQVPIHVIGPEALVARSAEWGLTPGLIPPADAAPIPMESMRDNLLRSFSPPEDVPPA
ncbi:sulfatase-like hydrolase/transferase [Paracoccus indicus]|uniref:sulfatase-like hydrolase/transferase n=1 Tax=Paracoccus indicus TaxID=2079229 RepID=UPI000D38A078|nr:sulfatase-like hydrolase/transferase [Paracoccus indicus]